MTTLQAIFLAFIQGLTEFLPVSSSGHLVLFQKIMNFENPPVLFDILLHFGTLGSILVFFRNEIIFILRNLKESKRTLMLLLLASIPTGVLGLFLSDYVSQVFDSIVLVGFAWIVGGIIILSTFFNKRTARRNYGEMSFKDALFIGFFQSLSLFPGISRSGSTISAGYFKKLKKEQAFSFSFLLAVPAIIGATGVHIFKADFSGVLPLINLLSMLTAGIVGYLALVLLKKLLIMEKFHYFGYYCVLLGIIVLLFALRL